MGQPAARIGDKVLQSAPHCHAPIHPAALVPTPVPHPAMPLAIVVGSPNVFIGGMPAARLSDTTQPCVLAACVPGGPGMIVKGSLGVFINGMPAARVGDMTSHAACVAPIPSPTGTIIPPGCPTVLIGDVGGGGAKSSSQAVPNSTTEEIGAPSPNADQQISLNDAAASGNKAAFEKAFKKIIGVSVQDSIEQYKADTGKVLDEQTIMTLFGNRAQSFELLTSDSDLNLSYRRILNQMVPANPEKAVEAGYTKLSWEQSLLHAPWDNTKYVGPEGHIEAVYDASGTPVQTGLTKQTFNFFGPDSWVGHIESDMIPWVSHGLE